MFSHLFILCALPSSERIPGASENASKMPKKLRISIKQVMIQVGQVHHGCCLVSTKGNVIIHCHSDHQDAS